MSEIIICEEIKKLVKIEQLVEQYSKRNKKRYKLI